MTTDKTPATLATAKHGGCVQLGDGWSGWATQYPGKMPKLCGAREIAELNHYPEEGQRLIFLSEQPVQAGALADAARAALPFVAYAFSQGVTGAEEAGRAIETALSAQPSPGGQGDVDMRALAESIGEVAHRLSTYMPHLSEWADRARDCKKAAEVLSALAARQPVCTTCDGSRVDPGGKPVCRDCSGARQPVGEPVGEVYQGSSRFPQARLTKPLPVGALLYASPPAQPVDLNEVREAVRKAWQKCAAGESVDLQFGTLLALIDSKAVGK